MHSHIIKLLIKRFIVQLDKENECFYLKLMYKDISSYLIDFYFLSIIIEFGGNNQNFKYGTTQNPSCYS